MAVVYYDGRFVPEHEGVIPLTDRGFQMGDGAYATIQVRDGIPLFLEAHLEQLTAQCRSFSLQMPPLSLETIAELIERNGAFEGIWRMKILVSGGDLADYRLPERKGRIALLIKHFTPPPFKPLKMGVFSVPYFSCHASFKSLAHLNRFYVMEEAYRLGLDDCITVTESGSVLEAAFGNLFWVLEKRVMTPDPSLPVYFGVTLKNALKMAQKLGYQIEYVKWKLADFPKEAAPFRTNTMQGIRPIAQIAERTFTQNGIVQTFFLKGYETAIEEQKKTAPPLRVPLTHSLS